MNFFDEPALTLYSQTIKTDRFLAAIAVDSQGRLCYANLGTDKDVLDRTLQQDICKLGDLRWSHPIPEEFQLVVDEYRELMEDPARDHSIQFRYLYGTDVQRELWEQLRRVKAGTTTTYSELAAHFNTVPRAVGGLVGLNRLALVVPCHRVLGKDGAITGFRGGVDVKKVLLQRELGHKYAMVVKE